MSESLQQAVQQRFPSAVLGQHSQHGDDTLIVNSDSWHAICRFLRDEQAMDMMMDLTAVDFPEREPRFEVVVHLYSLTRGQRLRLKSRVGTKAGHDAEIDSISDLWGSANWMERECYDMFGVRFRGHPDLRRILMYPEFEGHPLRRDYPAQKIQPLVPYREVPNVDKLAPFNEYEGMSFGRQVHGGYGRDATRDEELFPGESH